MYIRIQMEKASIFDTFKYVKRLKDAGFTDKQADTIKELLEDQLASKRDLRELENRVVLKVGAMIATSIVITAALVKMM